MSKCVFVTICDDGLYYDAQKAINSFKYFHPDVEIVRVGTKIINEYKSKLGHSWVGLLAPTIMLDIWNEKTPDLMIKMGADCFVLDRMHEVFDLEYDIACPRNDPDQVQGDERMNRPDVIRDIPNHEWVNADLICVKNKEFIVEYEILTSKHRSGEIKSLEKFGKVYDGDDQCSLNVVFRNGGFKSVTLDPQGSDLIYGSSGNWFDGSYHHGAPNNWSSWRRIGLIDGKPIMVDDGSAGKNRNVRVLHQGGGVSDFKMKFDYFNAKFQDYLKKITGFSE